MEDGTQRMIDVTRDISLGEWKVGGQKAGLVGFIN